MSEKKDEKWLDELISQTIDSRKPEFDPEKWKQKYPEEFQMLLSRAGQRTHPSVRLPDIWRRICKSRITKLAAAAVIVVASLFVISQLGGSTAAFARVIENVTNAESISFLWRQQLGDKPPLASRIYIQGEKIRHDLIGAEGEQQNTEKLRKEMKRRNITALLTIIGDFTNQEALELDHFQKTFKKTKMDDRAAEEFGKANIIGKFRNVKPEDVERTGEQSQNGQKIDVYLVKHVDLMGIKAELSGKEGERMTVWVDRASSLPAKILLEASFHTEGKSRDWLEFSEFAWNEPFDEDLFTLEVPEGYTPVEQSDANDVENSQN